MIRQLTFEYIDSTASAFGGSGCDRSMVVVLVLMVAPPVLVQCALPISGGQHLFRALVVLRVDVRWDTPSLPHVKVWPQNRRRHRHCAGAPSAPHRRKSSAPARSPPRLWRPAPRPVFQAMPTADIRSSRRIHPAKGRAGTP